MSLTFGAFVLASLKDPGYLRKPKNVPFLVTPLLL